MVVIYYSSTTLLLVVVLLTCTIICQESYAWVINNYNNNDHHRGTIHHPFHNVLYQSSTKLVTSRTNRIPYLKLEATKEKDVTTTPPPTTTTTVRRRRQSRSSLLTEPETKKQYIDNDAPAGIVGAEFFGGNKQKEEFFDPVAEAEALGTSSTGTTTTTIINSSTKTPETIQLLDRDVTSTLATTTTTSSVQDSSSTDVTTNTIDRFTALEGAFDCMETSDVARNIQQLLNSVLYSDATPVGQSLSYSTKLKWETPFVTQSSSSSTSNPLQEIEKLFDFYKRIDIAITSGTKISGSATTTYQQETYQLRYEIAVTWPTFWEPRVLLTGTSLITIDVTTKQIIEQYDILDEGNNNLVTTITKQVLPRFWDFYHIGMAPSAEMNPNYPHTKNKKLISTTSYKLYTVPPRIYLQPSVKDLVTNRDERNAAFIPNHAFPCAIVTMGPLKQRFSTTSEVLIQLSSSSTATNNNNNNNNNNNDNELEISWEIPLSVEYTTNTKLVLPSKDIDSMINPTNQNCTYVFKPQRLFATIPYYGTSPQDEQIATARKDLYQQVSVQDGYQPALDSSGRPKFFFLQKNVKACFTENGFGMAVYEWRPSFTAPNEIGIELIDSNNTDGKIQSKKYGSKL